MNVSDIGEGDVLFVGEEKKTITKVRPDYGEGEYGALVETEDGEEWVLFDDSEKAGEAAAERWRDMAQNYPKEFAAIIGEERLVQWALGQSDEFGIDGLDMFCEVTADNPNEEWASYDGEEHDGSIIYTIDDTEGAFPVVAYRHN
jgi:hypothetical protein